MKANRSHPSNPALSPDLGFPMLRLGKTFLHPIWDYALIGGGLSLAVCLFGWMMSDRGSVDTVVMLPMLLLISNYAHFAASTVRLYTKPGAFQMAPRLTMVFPAVTLLVLLFGVLFANTLGYHLFRLYVSWSPYHYSAQAYGIALIYLYRSGVQPSPMHKRLLWWACMMTFFKTMFAQPMLRSGIWWIVSPTILDTNPALDSFRKSAEWIMDILIYALPALVFMSMTFRSKARIPAISLLVVFTNALWFTLFPLVEAVTISTVFHGIQYLAIVMIFHVRDQMSRPGNSHGQVWHALTFYLWCFALGYMLFRCWPETLNFAGMGLVESNLIVAAIINIHHFIVDGFIWKLRGDPNSKIVQAA